MWVGLGRGEIPLGNPGGLRGGIGGAGCGGFGFRGSPVGTVRHDGTGLPIYCRPPARICQAIGQSFICIGSSGPGLAGSRPPIESNK